MACILRPKLNRIPGGGMPLAKKESYAKDLNKLTQVELMEIKEREEKLLKNKSKMQKLPDKGKRIQDYYDKVLKELERRSNVDEAAKLFSNLNIASQGEKALNELEWQGNLTNLQENLDPLEDVLDSDDENEMDPLKIIAQRQMHERKIKIEQPEVKLITEEDLKEIESFKADSPDSGVPSEIGSKETQAVNVIEAEIVAIDIKEKLDSIKPKLQTLNSSINSINGESRSSSACSQTLDLEPHVHYLVDITETNVQPATREKFRPYRTTISNVHDPTKERLRKQGKHWEITAATPPPIQHNGAQLLNLMDSVEIQAQYIVKLKELQEKQAADRLAAKLKRLEDRKIVLPSEEELKTKAAFTKYRNSKSQILNIEGEQKINEDDEVHDPLDEEKSGGVNYTVFD
ncbi:DNA-directed RNA polymerase II subunit GRINL1A [Calliphora vicina]|uniref:DNA-directed RNA polymerase II subunit GRINL1A n=1 Tax=Calliphora vicina TaxID=7373 RepID=UPI00325A5C91